MMDRPRQCLSIGKGLITLCCLFHGLALSVAYFPPESSLRETLFRPFSGYLGLLGFSASPSNTRPPEYLQGIRLALEAKRRNSATIEQFSPMIPHLTRVGDNFLVSQVFLSLFSFSQDSLELTTYAKQACKSLNRFHGPLYESVTLRFDRRLLRTLEEIRDDGLFAYTETTKKGPYPCT